MSRLTFAPPPSPIEPVTETLHGVPITDPYRWLEDQNSPETRAWIEEQTCYARTHLDNIRGRDEIRKRIREFLAIETYDSLQRSGNRYFFRKRLPDQEQPCIYMREEADGEDQLLVDPTERREGIHTAVRPLRASPDGRLLLYEIKEGGERTGTFALLDIESRRTLPDVLPRGYLRGFAFMPEGKTFLYVHEAIDSTRPLRHVACRHSLGTDFLEDEEVYSAGDGPQTRLCLIANNSRVGFLTYRFEDKTRIDFRLESLDEEAASEQILANADFRFGPVLAGERLFAITDRDASNLRIVELRTTPNGPREWFEVIPESEARIQQWLIAGDRILVSYLRRESTEIRIFDLDGKPAGRVDCPGDTTLRVAGSSIEDGEAFLETESFTQPITIARFRPATGEQNIWAAKRIPFDSASFSHTRVHFRSKDGTSIQMYLVGRHDVLAEGSHPTIMTSYGGYGIPMTPQFSVFVAFLIEQGCLFALPNIRGGSELGAAWHEAARRRNRQTAYDDFLSAAEWLIETGRTTADRLAIFGGSNSGLLVGLP